ncbi:hypothetical protein [Aminobacter carboxidus]|uniref:Uncharacterized protein n=1 Tax=Aminobacter carboxidus TaxID=376165 RepID=A0ABR9GUR1_9HYPH|nr:hypothetical protein [Aminobacter carboxidus]MBE1207418.1 hypothetical protein [Aminobacter carboxidus]
MLSPKTSLNVWIKGHPLCGRDDVAECRYYVLLGTMIESREFISRIIGVIVAVATVVITIGWLLGPIGWFLVVCFACTIWSPSRRWQEIGIGNIILYAAF